MGKLAFFNKLNILKRIATSWYVSLVFLGALGIALGYYAFFGIFPGKPEIGVIDIPFTVITDDSASSIVSFLDYARQRDSIKAVVIKLNSPGGGAGSSELLYSETVKLRQKKPVVIVVRGIAASGGYMMALGSNYTYTEGAALVGSVGVILGFPGDFIPFPPDDDIVTTGPYKLVGASRRDWVSMTDQLKQGFVQMVINERGHKLRVPIEKVATGQIYSGFQAVKMGLVDAVGSDADAIEKAASLAAISRYDLVDINVEALRIEFQKFSRIFESYDNEKVPLALPNAPVGSRASGDGTGLSSTSPQSLPGPVDLATLRRLLSPSTQESYERKIFGLPLTVRGPNLYYLYVGPPQ